VIVIVIIVVVAGGLVATAAASRAGDEDGGVRVILVQRPCVIFVLQLEAQVRTVFLIDMTGCDLLVIHLHIDIRVLDGDGGGGGKFIVLDHEVLRGSTAHAFFPNIVLMTAIRSIAVHFDLRAQFADVLGGGIRDAVDMDGRSIV